MTIKTTRTALLGMSAACVVTAAAMPGLAAGASEARLAASPAVKRARWIVFIGLSLSLRRSRGTPAEKGPRAARS